MAATISRANFLRTLPDVLIPLLPTDLQKIRAHQPWRWVIQFHYGEPRLHYEVSRIQGRPAYELALHFEERDKQLNKFLLKGVQRHLIEIKHICGDQIEAEPWDRGWAKIYEIFPEPSGAITTAYQTELASQFANFITHIQPIFKSVRRDVAYMYK